MDNNLFCKYNDSSVVTGETYCSEELSMLLKRHRFNADCHAFWKHVDGGMTLVTCDKENLYVCSNDFLDGLYDNALAAPTHQMVHDWLIDKKHIYIKIDCCPAANDKGYAFIGVVKDMTNKCMPFETPLDEMLYNSPAEAFETLCKYTLEAL